MMVCNCCNLGYISLSLPLLIPIAGSELRIGIVHARWNAKIIDALVDGAKKTLKECGVRDENIVLQTVPGSYELPFAVQR
jgi:6,7-dimethyl-8-ribityllumazine synthase